MSWYSWFPNIFPVSRSKSCLVFLMLGFFVEEVSQKEIPISYNIFFCGTFSTSAAEEEAPSKEEDTLAHMGKGLFINDDTYF